MTTSFRLYIRLRGSSETTLAAEAPINARGYWPAVWEGLMQDYDTYGYDSWVRWACTSKGQVTLGDVWRDYRRWTPRKR